MMLGDDACNRLRSASMSSGSVFSSQYATHAAYTYDAEGVRKTSTIHGVTTTYTTTTHGPLSQVLRRVRSDGKITWCVWGLGLLYEVEADLSQLTLIQENPPRYRPAERTLVHHHDQIGNTVAVTDDQQRDLLWVQYDPYGAIVHAEAPTQRDGGPAVRPEINALPDGLDRALAVTPFLFSGQQGVITDANGLLYMRARYYHPGLRRFVNPDPIGFEGGNNWYAYAGGNPLLANDPSGLAARASAENNWYGSKLGNTLGRIPVLGYALGPVGSLVSGIGNVLTGSFDTGFHQMGFGVGQFAGINVRDSLDFGIGMTAGKLTAIYRSISQKNIRQLVLSLLVPHQGAMTGANWGIDPRDGGYDSTWWMGSTKLDYASRRHDWETANASVPPGSSMEPVHLGWASGAMFGPGMEPGAFGQAIRAIGVPFFTAASQFDPGIHR